MKLIRLIALLLAMSSCKAQKPIKLEKFIINEFVNNSKSNLDVKDFFKNKQLYILGYENDFQCNEINVIYIDPVKARKKSETDGEFRFISLDDFIIDGKQLKTSIIFLVSKKNIEKFIYLNDFNESYCLEYDESIKTYKIFNCD